MMAIKSRLLERFSMFDTREVLIQDRVRTKSGRMGICIDTYGKDTAQIRWDDGEIFPIRFCHLEVLAHNVDMPAKYSKSRPE